jgi:adenylate cyclase
MIAPRGPAPWAHEIDRWVLRDGRRLTEPVPFVEALGVELCRRGAPIDRIYVAIRTLHPTIGAWAIEWDRSDGKSWYRALARAGGQGTEQFRGSPAEIVRDTKLPFRRRLNEELDPQNDHRLLYELKALGVTDYLAAPLPFLGDKTNMIAMSTRRRGGFSDGDIAAVLAMLPAIGATVESMEHRQLESSLLSIYIGARSARDVLGGRLGRGDGESFQAAVWYSDLRDFTRLTESLRVEQIIDMLNGYFEIVESAVAAQGGEVLQFIGDAILAVWRENADTPPEPLCRAAWAAAEDVYANLPVTNGRRRRSGLPPIHFGVGLHVGRITHCNVGSPVRLAFNVIGAPVNFTARLQGLTKEVGQDVLMSREFAEALQVPTHAVGTFTFKGVPEPREVFAAS